MPENAVSRSPRYYLRIVGKYLALQNAHPQTPMPFPLSPIAQEMQCYHSEALFLSRSFPSLDDASRSTTHPCWMQMSALCISHVALQTRPLQILPCPAQLEPRAVPSVSPVHAAGPSASLPACQLMEKTKPANLEPWTQTHPRRLVQIAPPRQERIYTTTFPGLSILCTRAKLHAKNLIVQKYCFLL